MTTPRSLLRSLYTTLLAGALFATRMLLLGVLSFLRWAASGFESDAADGGAELPRGTVWRPPSGPHMVN